MSSDFKNKQKGKRQISLLHGDGGSNWIMKVSKESTLLDRELLPTDAIEGKKVPEEIQVYLFHYTVTAYFTETKIFCATYMNRMILIILLNKNTLTSKKPMMAGLSHCKKVARYEDHGSLDPSFVAKQVADD